MLEEERHARGLRIEQIVTRMDALADAVDSTQKRQARDQLAAVDRMRAVMDVCSHHTHPTQLP